MGVKQVIDALAISNYDLPAIEQRFKRLRNDTSTLHSQKHICKRNLYQLNNQIAATSRLSNSLHICCESEKRKIEDICNEKARLESVVTKFKSNNEDYLKIKDVAEEQVKSVLTNGEIFLKFAIVSVIELLRRNYELYNFVLNDISNNNDTDTTSYGFNYLSLMLPEQQQQKSFSCLNDTYTTLIIEEAEKLYNKLTTELTKRVITAAAAMTASSLW